MQNKIKELTTMYHISNKFNSLNIFDDVYEKMIRIISEVMEVRSCGYYIADRENKELILTGTTATGTTWRTREESSCPTSS